jgi:RecA-family ATPase
MNGLPSEHLPDQSEHQRQAASRLTIRKPDEILAMEFDDSDRILGDRLLAKGQSMTILGVGGIGKSRLVLQLAVACITGKRFIALDTHAENLRWLFLQGENSNRRLQEDLAAMEKWAGVQWPEVNARIDIHTLEKEDDAFLNLDDPENVVRIRSAITDYNPDVVVFDTLNCFGIGELSKDQDMRETCQRFSRIAKHDNPERATVVSHHAITGKSGAAKASGYDRASFGRNSKVLHAWTRGQINVAPHSPDDNSILVFT